MIFWLYPPRRGSHTVLEERFQGPEVHVFSQFSVVVGHLCKRLGLMAPSALALCFPANVKCTRQLEETAGASVCWISQRTGFRNLSFLGVTVRHSHQCPILGQAMLISRRPKRERSSWSQTSAPSAEGKVLAVVSEEPAQNGFQWASVGTC